MNTSTFPSCWTPSKLSSTAIFALVGMSWPGSQISGEDFRGLRQLKERLGPRLEEAIILYTGEHAYTHDDWITVLPLDRLWT